MLYHASAPLRPQSTSDIVVFENMLAEDTPFAFVHINDGEVLAASCMSGTADRGLHTLSSDLKASMSRIIGAKSDRLYIVTPQANEFHITWAQVLLYF